MIMKRFALKSRSGHEGGKTIRARRMGLGLLLGTVAVALLTADNTPKQYDWPMFGQNPANTATNVENSISPKTASSLKMKWAVTTGGDVSARAAIVSGVAYFPDWGGNLWALNAGNGSVIWSHQLSDYGLATGTVSRTSPAVVNGLVYIGTQYNASSPASSGWLLAINAATGTLAWKTQPVTSNPFPVITGSPAVVNGVVYVGMTSNEEFAAAAGSLNYTCCSVSGSVVAVNAATGALIWRTDTVPAGYSGGAVWGSNPVVDVARNMIYVGTGNNYSVPTDPAYTGCISGGGSAASCQSPNNHADSILALDMTTGAIKWANRLETWNQSSPPYPYPFANGSDFWNVDCFVTFTNCPAGTGPDYDFGSAPNEITYQGSDGKSHTILGAGQKSGIYYALNPDTGAVLWQTQVGPGAALGGIEWGSASDGTRIYVAIGNLYGISYAAGSAGSWAALDPATGAILWQKADPNGAIDIGPMAVANGVVYAGSMGGAATAPSMFALNASTGDTVWSFASGASVIAGATIVNGTVYWGSGYAHLGIPGYTGNNKFYAFATH
jgi:polyvinyl alcohol dehydrogenase (cytochrome)